MQLIKGFVCGWVCACSLAFVLVPVAEKRIRKETMEEAFANGVAVKEIDKNDKVIYRWRETHDYVEPEPELPK